MSKCGGWFGVMTSLVYANTRGKEPASVRHVIDICLWHGIQTAIWIISRVIRVSFTVSRGHLRGLLRTEDLLYIWELHFVLIYIGLKSRKCWRVKDTGKLLRKTKTLAGECTNCVCVWYLQPVRNFLMSRPDKVNNTFCMLMSPAGVTRHNAPPQVLTYTGSK